MSNLTVAWARAWMEECAKTAHEHREELIELDRKIGDADHGENVDRGFAEVVKAEAEANPATPADVLKLAARTLISTVGGASGPLLGTAFLRASKALTAESVDSAQLAAMFEAGLEGIIARGKATEGEKTMVDAWAPAAKAARAAVDAGKDEHTVLSEAAAAAAEGVKKTVDMVATKGRASYLGERSVGTADPGATSSSLFFAAAVRAAEEVEGK
ncbi:MAG: dihydroxyacetone kinase subunit DhaL [Corynebacterium sp.]|nr:dihydroxyacetone kinase subunit DhaL [Corynebacterium sp.]